MYIIYDDFFLKHFTGDFHPENPARLTSIIEKINKSEVLRNLKFEKPVFANKDIISLVHSKNYIEKIKKLSQPGAFHYIDIDTIVTEHTYDCALLAAGACIKGVDILLSNDNNSNSDNYNSSSKNFAANNINKNNINSNDFSTKSFFALVRPPGHHAFSERGSGFCIFNNIAIAAKYAVEKYNLKRIVIIDFDVHHGNGTQDIFYSDSTVFYISIHQYPHYPGTGYYTETGAGFGKGFNLNIPVTPFSEEADYITAFLEIIFPVLYNYRPQLILVSAGFDAHKDDLLSSINLSNTSYFKIASLIRIFNFIINLINNYFFKINTDEIYENNNCAKSKINNLKNLNKKNFHKHYDNCPGIGFVLEGGYNLEAVAESVVKIIEAIDTNCQNNNENNINKDILELIMEFKSNIKISKFSQENINKNISFLVTCLKKIFLNDKPGYLGPNMQNKKTFGNIEKLFLSKTRYMPIYF